MQTYTECSACNLGIVGVCYIRKVRESETVTQINELKTGYAAMVGNRSSKLNSRDNNNNTTRRHSTFPDSSGKNCMFKQEARNAPDVAKRDLKET